MCSASIIHERFILTAAHCVHAGVDLTNARVVLGSNDAGNISEGIDQSFGHDNIIIHPWYKVSIYYIK